MAYTIGREGFSDLSFEDIDELLVKKALSKDGILEVVLKTLNVTEHSDNEKK